MKKLIAIMLALLLVASFSVTAFATEEEDNPSPTDTALIVVNFDSNYSGEMADVSEESYPLGSEITVVAPESEYEFIGFTVEGEYEVVSGGQYIQGAPSTRAGGSPSLTVVANSDLKIVALYNVEEEEETEPTTATQPDDEEGDSPQTGDSMLVYCIAGALIIGMIGFAVAGKKLLSKKEN